MPDEDPMDPIRVSNKDADGNVVHSTIRRMSLPHGDYTVLKQPAVDPLTGDFLPPEFPSADTSGAAASNKEKP